MNYLIFFKDKKKEKKCNDNLMVENTQLGRVIVMDDVSGLAGKSTDFANFLTVSRKFGFDAVTDQNF